MQLTKPINLIGIKEDAASGNVVTCQGIWIGRWVLLKDEALDIGQLQFMPYYSEAALFVRKISVLKNCFYLDMAVTSMSYDIQQWHKAQNRKGAPSLAASTQERRPLPGPPP